MRIYSLFIIVSLACVACGDTHPADQAENRASAMTQEAADKITAIEALEAQVSADSSGQNLRLRQQLLVAYSDFINFNNAEEMTPEYLFRAAKLANEVGKPRKAIEHLINLHDGFPKYPRRTEAAFLIAFLYENMLNDREMAEKYYEKVVELYPESTWAEDAKASLKLLYLTDEEKIAKFIEQNKAVQ
jgi:tetratricopeptide (TPR) repeat protein